MHINNKLIKSKQQRIQHYAQNSSAYCFFDLLTSPELLDKVDSLLPEHRERLFPPTETLSLFLTQALSSDRSCQKAVNTIAVNRVLGGLSSCSTHTGGYCKARQRLPTEMVSTLTHHIAKRMENQSPAQWHWKNRRVCLIDGTTVTMPDTVENQNVYPQHKGIKQGLGFPICRIVGVVSLSSGAILNAVTGKFNGKGSSEQTLLRTMLNTFIEGDVVVGDAFFGTYALLSALINKGVDSVFEQMGVRKRAVNFRKGKRLGSKDHLITLYKPVNKPSWMACEEYACLPETIEIRELEVNGKLLITTLLSAKTTPKHELKQLYQQRWNIELDFRSIKTTLGMEVLSCKTPAMIEKEIWVYFLAYNLIRLLIVQAACLNNILPRQLSFKHTLQIWQAWIQTINRASKNYNVTPLFTLIAQQRVGNRSGRIEPRAVKKRPKPYPMLMKPRCEAQAEVKKNGHYKKLK